MIDISMTHLVTSCIAMILVALAITAYEFLRTSNLQIRRNPLALQTAPEMTPVRVRVYPGRTR